MSSLAAEIKENKCEPTQIRGVRVRCGGDAEHVSFIDLAEPGGRGESRGGLCSLRADWV